MVYTVNGENYTRRKKIPVTGAGSGAQTDFQIKLATIWAAAMQVDFDDVRFTKADMQTLIDAWLESKVDSTSANIWVEFPTTPADGVEEDEAYMYFGNAGAVSDWDIGATGLFGDDFPGSSLDTTNNWDIISGSPTVNNGLSLDDGERIDTKTWTGNTVSLRLKATVPNETGTTVWCVFGLSENTLSPVVEFLTYFNWDVRSISDAGSEITTIAAYNGEHIFEIKKNAGAEAKFYVDDVLKDTDTTWVPNVAMPIRLGKTGANNLLINWVFAHKYVANPPTYAFGTEEHQRRTPMMM